MTEGKGLTKPTSEHDPVVYRLHQRLRRIGPLQEVTARLPRSGVEYIIARPEDVDGLLEAAEDDPEENLPYWAALWPSGIALADAVLADQDAVSSRRVLELGSGIGVTAIAALSVDADLVASDYSADSLALCRYNTLVNTGREPVTRQFNWRSPDPSFIEFAGDGFPVVLAADVLYEQRDIEPLLRLVERIIHPGGILWLAEPRRNIATRFLEKAGEHGWFGAVDTHTGPWPELNDTGVQVRVHRLRRPL